LNSLTPGSANSSEFQTDKNIIHGYNVRLQEKQLHFEIKQGVQRVREQKTYRKRC
jgi:hypothetical protein